MAKNVTKKPAIHPTSTPGAKTTSSPTSPAQETDGAPPIDPVDEGTGSIPIVQPVQPTATPSPTPIPPTPTPHPCLGKTVSSNPIYQGDGYAYSNGGTLISASGYCSGKVYFIFTEKPAVTNTQVRLCINSNSCGSWIKFTSVGSKLLIKSGMSEGVIFHLQFQGYGATKSYMVYGYLYY
jgi:hypothetical protein